MGNQPHGAETGITMIRKLLKLRKSTHKTHNCMKEKRRNTTHGENDDEVYNRQTHERTKRTPTQERECKACGQPLLSRTVGKIRQKLKPQCAENMTQEDRNHKACLAKNCNGRATTREAYKHTCSIPSAGNILQALNRLAANARKYRTKMIHTGAPKEYTTCLQNNTTYSARTQQWTCYMCDKRDQPQDIQNMIRHVFWRKKKNR